MNINKSHKLQSISVFGCTTSLNLLYNSHHIKAILQFRSHDILSWSQIDYDKFQIIRLMIEHSRQGATIEIGSLRLSFCKKSKVFREYSKRCDKWLLLCSIISSFLSDLLVARGEGKHGASVFVCGNDSVWMK